MKRLPRRGADMEVGLLTAFLGGALALLSPCGALLLPGFFASTVLIALGAAHALGLGFDLSRLLPGLDRAQQASSRGAGLPRTFLLGAVGGVAGFCAGPILGAVLTLAMGQGSMTLAAILLAV